jgi:hypothetical protein
VKSLETVTGDFVVCLKREFAAEISRHPREFKKQVLRFIRHGLPPQRGRPRDPKTEAALAMLQQGKTVRRFYGRKCAVSAK